jgi:hypothetical protein
MKLTKEIIKNLPGLRENSHTPFNTLALPEKFTARQAAGAYLAAGGKVQEIARAYGALLAAGLIPDTGAIWRIARLAFAVQSKESGLRAWAESLGPENCKAASAAAWAASAADVADAAEAAAHAAEAAAYADEAAYAAFQAAYADDATEADAAKAAGHAYATALFTALAAARQAANDDKVPGSHLYAAEVAAINAQEAKILEIIFQCVGE